MPRILVVEDEVRLASALRQGLIAEGFNVDVALDGDQGWWMATENEYDAMVLDIMLPKKNGYEICRELRSAGKWTPILMLTAKTGEHDEAEALDTGADDFLSKPFSYVVLVARLRALLRRGSQWVPPVIEVGDLIVDPGRHRVLWLGREVELTRREFAVLEFLASRSGQVVSKQQILDQVWDYTYAGDPNIVEVYISFLRRKLEGASGRRLVRTVRGVGYRLEPSSDG